VTFAMLRVRFVGAWFGVDGDVIHIDGEPSLSHFFAEYCVYHHLEGCWRVGEAEEHDGGFKKSFWGEECGLPFVSILDTDIIVSLSDVEFSKQGTSAKAIDCLWNEWGDISIFLSPFIDWSVVLDWS
jgi:hypothetical protein